MAANKRMMTTQYRQVASFLSTTLMSLTREGVEEWHKNCHQEPYPVVARSLAFTFSVLSPMSSMSSFWVVTCHLMWVLHSIPHSLLCSAHLSKYLLSHSLLPNHNVMQHVQARILLGQQLLLVLPYLKVLGEEVLTGLMQNTWILLLPAVDSVSLIPVLFGTTVALCGVEGAPHPEVPKSANPDCCLQNNHWL